MVTRTHTISTLGLKPTVITVEVDSVRGIPQLQIIGLPSKTVTEARERFRAAFAHCGVSLRHRRTILNLAPADVPKTSAALELAMAVALLIHNQSLDGALLEQGRPVFVGELSLDGSLRPVKGLLPLALAAIRLGFSDLYFPASQAGLLRSLKEIKLHPLDSLQNLIDPGQATSGGAKGWARPKPPQAATQPTQIHHIAGQALAKRALLIAAAGGHHLLMTGPPGCGKSLLASSLASILPRLTAAEQLEVTSIHSLIEPAQHLLSERPFRAPHQTTSHAGLIGGTSALLPGEVSLAHHGVLFLDEIAEFPRRNLEALRQPLSTGAVTIKRAKGSAIYPAQFTLIAATNPCPCGYQASPKRCQCSDLTKTKYAARISGPLRDRIDLQLAITNTALIDLTNSSGLTSDQLRAISTRTRQIQEARYQDRPYNLNCQLPHQDLISLLAISPPLRKYLKIVEAKLQLSTRAIFSLLRVARTIADLEMAEDITKTHLQEAVQFRIS